MNVDEVTAKPKPAPPVSPSDLEPQAGHDLHREEAITRAVADLEQAVRAYVSPSTEGNDQAIETPDAQDVLEAARTLHDVLQQRLDEADG